MSAIYLHTISNGSEIVCKYNDTIDVTDGILLSNDTIVKGNLTFPKGKYRKQDDGTIIGCICDVKTCLRKCCSIGQAYYYSNNTCAFDEDASIFEVYAYDLTRSIEEIDVDNGDYYFYWTSNNFCERPTYSLKPWVQGDEFYVQTDGKLYLPNAKLVSYANPMSYCVEKFKRGVNQFYVSAKICPYWSKFDNVERILYNTGKK